MQPSRISLYRIHIPFRRPFEHASARRLVAENILLRYVSTNGVEGWGETIAREYVTGDSTDQVIETCRQIPGTLWNRTITTADDVSELCDAAGLSDANVARCAVEIALLDCLARHQGQPVGSLLASSWPRLAQVHNEPPFQYSGPLGVGSLMKTAETALKLRLFGLRSVKIKLTGDSRRAKRTLRVSRAILGPRVDVRVDANESWTLDTARAMASTLRACRVTAVEQPFPKGAWQQVEEFYRLGRTPIIFDESLCSESDARVLVGRSFTPVFAVKLAKLGGFRHTLNVLAIAAEHGVPVQISCQVGESAILSAAGRALAALCPNLRYLEGSYDRFLLSENVATEDITVGKGGIAPALDGPGLGISIDPQRVERLSVQKLDLFSSAA